MHVYTHIYVYGEDAAVVPLTPFATVHVHVYLDTMEVPGKLRGLFVVNTDPQKRHSLW